MPAEPQNPALVECRRPDGTIFARLRLWPTRAAGLAGEAHPLIRWSAAEAHARREEVVQLCERCRYVYRLLSLDAAPTLVLSARLGISHNPAADAASD